MTVKAVSTISGGLDSTLATKLMLDQGIDVEGVSFHSVLGCCKDDAQQACDELGIRLTMLEKTDDYLALIRSPKYQYGKGINPCCDCRIFMFDAARRFAEKVGAAFVVSGEVIGQRPNSQMRRHLALIEKDSGLEGRLLRPLSAKLLEPTIPEREGWVDREHLYDFHGRHRVPLIELAHELGIRFIPNPSTGCALTEPDFARKVQDMLDHTERESWWDYRLLQVGRHFRLESGDKVVVGRNQDENRDLERMHRAQRTVVMIPRNFLGSVALVENAAPDQDALATAGRLVLRYTKKRPPEGESALFELIGAAAATFSLAEDAFLPEEARTLAI